MALPAAAHSFCLSSLNAGLEEELGKLIPNASMAAGHRICGVHTTTGTCTRTRVLYNSFKIFFA